MMLSFFLGGERGQHVKMSLMLVTFCLLLHETIVVDAFLGSSLTNHKKWSLRSRGAEGLKSHNNNGGRSPPSGRDDCFSALPHEDFPMSFYWTHNQTSAATIINSTTEGQQLFIRGGSSDIAVAENVVKGAQATMKSSVSYWSDAFQSFTNKIIVTPFQVTKRSVSSLFQSKQQKQEALLMKQLKTMPVERVTVPNSTLLPADIIQAAAHRSYLIGNPLRMDRVQDFAHAIQQWYRRRGYVLHAVTGATLRPESATAEIEVQEPVTSREPVKITFVKEMVVDSDDGGSLLTFRQYKEKHARRRTAGTIDKANLNTTFVETIGRTRPSKLARALSLQPGRPFQWDGSKWQAIVQSGIFGRILRAEPQPSSGDGGAQLHIVAQEAPPRHLEYGVGRSLYTGSWEGEVEFEHGNLLGGGETLGVKVRRDAGSKAQPSVRVGFTNGKFGMPGGYNVDVFTEYLEKSAPPPLEKKSKKNDETTDTSEVDEETPVVPSEPENKDELDTLLNRRGATFRIQSPFGGNSLSMASVSLERAKTKTGYYEDIASTTVRVGPFVKELPMEARSNVDFKVTTGSRLADYSRVMGLSTEENDTDAVVDTDENSKGSIRSRISSRAFGNRSLLPFVSATASTRQLFPLIATVGSGSNRRYVTIALEHSCTTSSRNLPRHEARAQGLSCSIRGVPENGRVSLSIQGTTELRVPVDVPIIQKVVQDASIVVFSDWLVAKKESTSPFFRKSCYGIGLRNSVQGFPLKFDVTYSKESKIKTSVGMGRDFDI